MVKNQWRQKCNYPSDITKVKESKLNEMQQRKKCSSFFNAGLHTKTQVMRNTFLKN